MKVELLGTRIDCCQASLPAHARLTFMTASIRRAKREDAAAIARVQVVTWRTTYAGLVPESYLAAMNPEELARMWNLLIEAGKDFFHVVEDESGVFGFISGGPIREPVGDYDAELHTIYLLHEHQRSGTGLLLVETLVRDLLGAGFRSMVVWVLAQNPAVHFYKRLGAIEISRRTVEIGGALLDDRVLGWPDLSLSF
jgi:L-amino acid N-acyltransferase YncA